MTALNPFGPPPELYGYQTLWHSIGNYMARLELYEASLPFFTKAVDKCPNNKKILVDRGKVLGKVCYFNRALEDINKAINLDPNDLVSLAERSHAIYLSCEFEDAIVQNYRLLPLRKKPDHFEMGVRKCSSAIQNCLGKAAGSPLRDHFLIIRKLAWLETFNAGKRIQFVAKNKKVHKVKKKKRPKTKSATAANVEAKDQGLKIRDSLFSHQSDKFTVPPLNKVFKFSPLQRFTSNIENYMAETYLERMYREKIFVKELRTRPGVNCPNQAGVAKLKTLAKDCYKTVYDKQEVLRTRRPFYNIKYQQAKITGSLKNRQEALLSLLQENTRKELEKILLRLDKALAAKNLLTVLELVEKVRQFCDSKSKKLLPDKHLYLAGLIKNVRDAFYNVNRLNPEQPSWDQEKRILVSLGQPISRSPSHDSVINMYQVPLLDYNQQIQLFEKRLEAAAEDEEMIWYYHEIARYHMLAKRYDLAKSFCTRCILLAEKNDDLQWTVIGRILSMRICIRQQNKNDAIIETTKAIATAKQLKDRHLLNYLEKCENVIADIEFNDQSGKRLLEKRQAKILALMQSDKIKSEFSHLFHTMSALPASRRMSLIPGVKKTEAFSASRSRKSLKSIGFDEENYSSSSTKGANFVNLMEYHF